MLLLKVRQSCLHLLWKVIGRWVQQSVQRTLLLLCTLCVALQVFNQSSAVQEDAGWRDNLYRMYTASSANMRVAVYGSKHDAGNYEELLRKFCAVTELVCGV